MRRHLKGRVGRGKTGLRRPIERPKAGRCGILLSVARTEWACSRSRAPGAGKNRASGALSLPEVARCQA